MTCGKPVVARGNSQWSSLLVDGDLQGCVVFVFIISLKGSIRIHINSPHKVVQASRQIRGHGLQLLGVCRDVIIQHLKEGGKGWVLPLLHGLNLFSGSIPKSLP